jgi:NADH:ubiquinone oxidoreductase subunit K
VTTAEFIAFVLLSLATTVNAVSLLIVVGLYRRRARLDDKPGD